MASSENLTIESWNLRTTFADSWISEAFNRDTETLTKALQKSLSNSEKTTMSSSSSPFFNRTNSETIQTQTVSEFSGSETETVAPKRSLNLIPVQRGKVTKRKSRASKKSQTTFITADPTNFRQMVQQVTGVRFGNGQVQLTPILKPEAYRPGSRFSGGGGWLPTLDTSAFLLEHHQQRVVVGSLNSGVGVGSGIIGSGDPLSFGQNAAGDAENSGVGGLDFETFPSFPTLESWKVM